MTCATMGCGRDAASNFPFCAECRKHLSDWLRGELYRRYPKYDGAKPSARFAELVKEARDMIGRARDRLAAGRPEVAGG